MEENNESTNERSWKEKINFNTVIAVITLLLSITLFILVPYQIEKPRLFMGRQLMALPPTAFPRLIISGLIILSIWYLIFSFYFEEDNPLRRLTGKAYVRILITLGVAIGYGLAFEPLGFVISSILAVGTLTLFFGNRNYLLAAAITFIGPIAVYLVFTRAFRVSLPEMPFFGI